MNAAYRYCPRCRAPLARSMEDGHPRLKCPQCGWCHYDNPLPSVAAFVRDDRGGLLLVKRGTEPGRGKWALPSGFIEQHETPEHACLRELREETGVTGKITRMLGAFVEPTRIYGDILLLGYAVQPTAGRLRPGSDSAAVRYFKTAAIAGIPFASHRALAAAGMSTDWPDSTRIEVLKSKITLARITHCVLFYNGSIGIDGTIMRIAGLVPGEKVHVLNYDNGERFETYVIEERSNSGKIALYGPAARRGSVGERVCILSYALTDFGTARSGKPRVVELDRHNRPKHA